jgi:ATP/maltotriose-dependent transcriptional regulator MalT
VGQLASALPGSEDETTGLLRDLLVGVGGLIEGKDASALPLIRGAIRRAAAYEDPRVVSWAATGASTIGDEVAEATLLRRNVETARASASVDTLVLALETVVSAGMVSGHLDIDTEASEGLRLAREIGLPNAATAFLAVLAWLAGLRGDEAGCRAYADEAGQLARKGGMANSNSTAEWGVALLDLGVGRPEQAATRLASLRLAPLGVGHPFFALLSAADLIEAYVRSNRREEARAILSALEAFAQPGAPVWSRAAAARSRGLLADNGDPDAHFTAALQLYSQCNRLFDRSRTELLYGEFLRRERRRGDARERLRVALAGFEQLGAEPWAERARTELRATGETARKRNPSTLAVLTAQELQIARLVAEGRSNKSVAAHLFLSHRTVEYHLSKIFTKLGIASRAELMREGISERRPSGVVMT